MTSESPSHGLHLAPQMTSSESCFSLLTAWIDCCVSTHNACSVSEPALLPTGVIDIGDQAEQPIRLFLGQGSIDCCIALSHCWANQGIVSTTLATLEDRKRNIPWESLFQDAVIIARKLRVRFIWIDSLCNIQDDSEDREIESEKLGSIYENSYLTISATASAHGNHVGCFGLRPSENVSSNEITRHREDGQPITIRVRKVSWERHHAIIQHSDLLLVNPCSRVPGQFKNDFSRHASSTTPLPNLFGSAKLYSRTNAPGLGPIYKSLLPIGSLIVSSNSSPRARTCQYSVIV